MTDPSPPSPSTVRGRWVVGIVLVTVLAVVGGVWWAGRRDPAPDIPTVDPEGLDADVVTAVARGAEEVRKRPQSGVAWGQLGCVFFAYGLESQALVCLTRAETLDGADPRWPYFLGMIRLRSDAGEGIRCLRRAAQRAGSEVAPLLRLAEALLAQGQGEEAETLFRRVLELHADNPRAYLGLGQLAVRRGDLKGSIPLLSRAASSAFSRRAAQVALAEVYLRLGDTKAADQAQQRVAELPPDPAWPDPLLQQVESLRAGTGTGTVTATADAMADQGRVPEAIAMLEDWIRQHPDANQAYLSLGRIYFNLGDGPAAERVLRRLWALEPNGPAAPFLLGGALSLQKDYRGAAECFRKTIELKPDHAHAYYNLGICLVALGDRDGAITAFRAAIRYKPDLANAHTSLADLLTQPGQEAEALDHLRQALRLAPDDRKAKELLNKLESRLHPGAPPPAPKGTGKRDNPRGDRPAR
jgi:tetratricopeptide (TPR) repeat protein